eukprot:5474513-Prymnesium_polylepis.1
MAQDRTTLAWMEFSPILALPPPHDRARAPRGGSGRMSRRRSAQWRTVRPTAGAPRESGRRVELRAHGRRPGDR